MIQVKPADSELLSELSCGERAESSAMEDAVVTDLLTNGPSDWLELSKMILRFELGLQKRIEDTVRSID